MVNKVVEFKLPRFFRGLISQKRGVSAVIATVLILLLTITSIGVLVAILIPFVQNNLDKSDDCLNTRGGITIVRDSDKSCYSPDDPIGTKVTVKRGNVDIDGLYIVLEDGVGTLSSASYEIINGSTPCPTDVTCPTHLIDGKVVIPSKGGGEKTYEINSDYREVSVGAMVKGKRCPNPDSDKLKLCIN